MTQPWTFAGEPPAESGTAPLTLVEGSTFCISEPTGDIRPDRTHGLFVRDTRVLSRWELTVGGAVPTLLAVQRGDPYAAACLSRVPPQAGLADSTLLVVRRRYVGDGMREDLCLRNTGRTPAAVQVVLSVDADFADLFEVKDGRAQRAPDVRLEVAGAAGGDVLRLAHRRGGREQGLLVSADGDPSVLAGALCWQVELPPRGRWEVTIEAVPAIDGEALPLRHPRGSPVEHAAPAQRLREWRRRSPEVRTGDAGFATALRRSVEDLGALRIFDPHHPERAVVAAGSPWFMALFGRDSLLTSWMVLPLDQTLAIGTLQTLADHQGVRHDPASEEEPGRILHEIRFGPAADFALGGRSVYYGTADATALFVMLLGELLRWGGDRTVIAGLLPHADRALQWIEDFGDADGDLFVEYRRKTEAGLVNQGWKDSWDGVNSADGTLAQAPIALAEVQAYVYGAYVARAELAAAFGDPAGQRRWAARAAALKAAFDERFWLPDRGWYATALDGAGRPVDALTSNIGHCLWTGLVADDKAAAVADHLLSPELFTGWGIRTLAESMGAYNPMSYHNGSVWPHDNAICVAGLMRYGFVEHAQRVTLGLLDAAGHFAHRLPELFCGFSRTEFPAPVPYPASCSPQAWAAAAPISLLRSLLRFDPTLPGGQVACDPVVPPRLLPLHVSGLRVGPMDLAIDVPVDRGLPAGPDGVASGWSLSGLAGSGVDLVAPAAPPRPARAPAPASPPSPAPPSPAPHSARTGGPP